MWREKRVTVVRTDRRGQIDPRPEGRLGRRARVRTQRPRRRATTILAAIFLVLLLPAIGDAVNGYTTQSSGCRVIGVIDGDTVRLDCPKSGFIRGRVLAYDAPEFFSPQCVSEFAKAIQATFYLRYLLWSSGKISATIDGTDRYGRALIVLIADEKGIAGEMVEAGLGRWYDGGSRDGWCA